MRRCCASCNDEAKTSECNGGRGFEKGLGGGSVFSSISDRLRDMEIFFPVLMFFWSISEVLNLISNNLRFVTCLSTEVYR